MTLGSMQGLCLVLQSFGFGLFFWGRLLEIQATLAKGLLFRLLERLRAHYFGILFLGG